VYNRPTDVPELSRKLPSSSNGFSQGLKQELIKTYFSLENLDEWGGAGNEKILVEMEKWEGKLFKLGKSAFKAADEELLKVVNDVMAAETGNDVNMAIANAEKVLGENYQKMGKYLKAYGKFAGPALQAAEVADAYGDVKKAPADQKVKVAAGKIDKIYMEGTAVKIGLKAGAALVAEVGSDTVVAASFSFLLPVLIAVGAGVLMGYAAEEIVKEGIEYYESRNLSNRK